VIGLDLSYTRLDGTIKEEAAISGGAA